MEESKKETELEKSIKWLKKSIDKLDINMQKEVSFKRSFLLSIVRWIGYTLGATIVASIVVFILAYILNITKNIPFLRDIFNAFM